MSNDTTPRRGRGHRPTGKNADPEFRRGRARQAARARTGLSYHLRKLLDAGELTAEQAADLQRVIDSAPPPTPEVAEVLRALLPPVPRSDRGQAA